MSGTRHSSKHASFAFTMDRPPPATSANANAALRALMCANFPELDDALMPDPALLQGGVSLRRLARGRTLFAQGQPALAFYGLVAGEIEARFTGLDGTVSVLEHVQAPRLFGLAAFAAGQAASYETLATQSSQVLVIGSAAYTLLMDRWPGFARALMAEFARRYDGTLRLLEASRHRSAPERFALALAQLRRDRAAGPPDAQGWQTLRATQAELAAVANLSRQTVNQLLQQAQAEGRLRCSYGQLHLRIVS
ncbi:MAG: Crp/Fnr family transcriptional regulator [Paucibacter sp.]|nr:Crp/Fnr family transcriptional regulator [Roseateles sp.]